MAQITQQYTNPATGLNSEVNLTAELIKLRLDSQTDTPKEDWCIRLSGGGVSSYVASVNNIVEDGLDGRPSSAPSGKIWTRVKTATAGATAVIPVDWTTGFVEGDVVALLKSDGTYEYAYVDAVVAATSIAVYSVQAGVAVAGFVQAVKIGDRILNVANEVYTSSLGEGSVLGLKSQLEKPGTPTFVLAQGAGNSIGVTITAPASNSATIAYYDVYVSDVAFTTIPVGQEPDSKNNASIVSAINVTTFGGGANARMFADAGAGGAIGTGTAYWVAVVAKTGTGLQDVNMSSFTVSTITTD